MEFQYMMKPFHEMILQDFFYVIGLIIEIKRICLGGDFKVCIKNYLSIFLPNLQSNRYFIISPKSCAK